MPHLYLPAEHTDADRALACRVAEAIDSDELFVAWTCDSGVVAAPEVQAPVRRPAPSNPFAEVLREVVVSFMAVFDLIFRPGRRHSADTGAPAPRTSRSELEGADL